MPGRVSEYNVGTAGGRGKEDVMTRVRRLGWLGWVLLGLALLVPVGCGGVSDEGDEGDGGDGGGNGGAYCGRAINKFNACGMGAFIEDAGGCTEPDSAEDRCTAECIIRASCADLRVAICGGEAPTLLTCIGSCEPPPFRCGSGEEVPEDWHCDNSPDCTDGSDELGCPSFTCANGEMVDAGAECNSYRECADGSDEHPRCPGVFQCTNGQTVAEEWECDGFPDCVDASDEHQGCPPPPTVTCLDGTTVQGARCDEYPDCPDGSDEPSNCPPSARDQICGIQ
jgi:hypothetical protein